MKIIIVSHKARRESEQYTTTMKLSKSRTNPIQFARAFIQDGRDCQNERVGTS